MRNLISGALAVFALLATGATSRAASVVAPLGKLNIEGNTHNYYPFDIGATGGAGDSQRYQQVYDASDFASSGPILITQIAFRPDAFVGRAFMSILPDIQINLSTISLGPDGLSLVFANNVGLDDTIVLARGPLSLSSNFTGPQGGPLDFDVVITLTTPFFYNPAAGNLLMDVRNFGGGMTTVLDAQDTTGDSISRVFTTISSPGGVDSPNAGHSDSAGAVTQFTYTSVPEPGAGGLLLVGGGLCCVLAQRRLRPPKL
jgi:hypothetical protein